MRAENSSHGCYAAGQGMVETSHGEEKAAKTLTTAGRSARSSAAGRLVEWRGG